MCQRPLFMAPPGTDEASPAPSNASAEVRDVVDAAKELYARIDEYAPSQFFPEPVEQAWRRLGEALAWLRD